MEEYEAARKDGRRIVTSLQRQLRELRLLVRQIEAELQQLAPRRGEREEQIRLLEASPSSFTPIEMRDAYAALAEISNKLFLLQTQLESLRQRDQTLSQHAAQLEQMLGLLERLTAGAPALAVPTAEHDDAQAQPILAVDWRLLVAAREADRQQSAQQLLTGPVQMLSNLILQAEISLRLLSKDRERAVHEMRGLKEALASSLGEVRRFAGELSPPALAEIGLRPTVRRFVDDFSSRHGVPVQLTGFDSETRLPAELELHLFRASQESLQALRVFAPVQEMALSMAADAETVCLECLAVYANGAIAPAESDFAAGATKAYAQAWAGHLIVDSPNPRTIRIRVVIPLPDSN
ncbi:MAG: sensor histidine kinase [Chloroflexota bacterium]